MASGRQSFHKSSDEVVVVECDVCSYSNKDSDATSFCEICSEYLCKACTQAHRGSKATRDHRIVIGLFSAGTSDTLTEMRENTEEILVELTFLRDKCEAFKRTMIDYKETIESTTTAYIQDFKLLKERIEKIVDAIEHQVVEQVSEFKENKLKEMEDHMIVADKAIHDLNIHKRVLAEYQKTGDVKSMLTSQRVGNELKAKHEKNVSKLNVGIHSSEMQFEPTKIITDLLRHLKSLGAFQEGNEESPTNILTLSGMLDYERKEIDVGSRNVCDCTFIGDSHLVLACVNDGLVLLDKDFNITSSLPKPTLGVATFNSTEVIATKGSMLLRFVSVFPQMAVTKTLKMDRQCYGVDVLNNDIYVTYHDNPGNGEVRALNMYGGLMRKIKMSDGVNMLNAPDCVRVRRDGSQIFVSDRITDEVTCFGQNGDVLHRYSDDGLKGPSGMFLDDAGILFVCCGTGSSHRVHMIRQNGEMKQVILSKEDMTTRPVCLAYRQIDGFMVVGLVDAEKPLLVFNPFPLDKI